MCLERWCTPVRSCSHQADCARDVCAKPEKCFAQIVFRSGRTGDKNLYIMSTRGEEHGLLRLTEGPWDDTMPGWTPASGWIVFASSRNYVDSNRPAGAFDIFMVRLSLQDACLWLYQGYISLATILPSCLRVIGRDAEVPRIDAELPAVLRSHHMYPASVLPPEGCIHHHRGSCTCE